MNQNLRKISRETFLPLNFENLTIDFSMKTQIYNIDLRKIITRQKLILSLLFTIIAALSFVSCDSIPSEVVDVKNADYKVTSINAPASVNFLPADSSVVTTVKIEKKESVNKAWISIISADGKIVINNLVELKDDGQSGTSGDTQPGDGVYSAKFFMSRKNPNGNYIINYYIEDNVRPAPDNQMKIGTHHFGYKNSTQNFAPVISDLNFTSSVSRGQSFIFTVKADDQNGLQDIALVFFKLFRPDGTLSQPSASQDYFIMVDNGDVEGFGDIKAGDGIFSFKNSFGTTSQTGNWRFEFQAKDKSNEASGVIIHNLQVNP